jgi:hypothetical protein
MLETKQSQTNFALSPLPCLDENTSICEWANFVCILDVDEGEDPNGDYHDRLDLIQVFLIGNNISGTLPANIGGLNNWHPNIKFNVLYISHNSECVSGFRVLLIALYTT